MSDLINVVINVGTAIDMPVLSSDIRDIYRLPGKPGINSPIVINFTSVQTKLRFLAQAFSRTSIRNTLRRTG